MSIPAGRVETLTPEQEVILKQVWGHLFNFWGIPVEIPASSAAPEAVPEKKKKGLFSKFKKSSDSSSSAPSSSHSMHSSASHRKFSVSSHRSRESIEAEYSGSIHDALKELAPQQIRENLWNMLRTDTPDNLVLRFVRARKWDTDKALHMLAHTLQWRLTESNADDIFFSGELGAYARNEKGLVKNIELMKAHIRGHDNVGRPIVLIRPKLHLAADQSEQEVKDYTLLVIEYARLFLKDPIDTASIIFDLTDFSMNNMDYAPVKYMISCFEAHYPECLGKLFIHKAPWIFPPIWNIIKNWLDPVVAAKISFTKTTADLNKHIPMSSIPEYLGGEDKFDFNYTKPDESVDVLLKDTAKRDEIKAARAKLVEQFMDATKHWIQATDATESAKYLNEKIRLGKELSKNYIELDPYVRSRSAYDVDGTLKL